MIITNITISQSQKCNHALYGGSQYESSDHFCSLTAEIDETEDVTQISKDLKEYCDSEVQKSIASKIMSFQGGIPKDEFDKYLQAYVAGRQIDPNTYEALSPLQKETMQIIKKGKSMAKRDSKD